MAQNYLELIPRPDPATVNFGLTSPKLATLRAILGEPRASYTGECQPVSNPTLAARMKTMDVGPFRATGVDVALESMKAVFAQLKAEIPDLHDSLSSAGMTCARKVKLRQPNGTIKLGNNPSNHSWGLAIDIKINDQLDRQGDNKCYRGLLILSKYFNAAGWYWGVSFPTEDAMHFEVSERLIRKWRADGKI